MNLTLTVPKKKTEMSRQQLNLGFHEGANLNPANLSQILIR